MRLAAALLLLAGCSKIFGLSAPQHAADAAGDATDTDATDARIDIADAAPGHCVTQADCPTSVCLPTTMCAAEADVAWLSQAGAPGTACTMAQPCSRLLDALNAAKPYVRVQGTISNLTGINQDVAFFGEPGGGFSGRVQANSGAIGFYDLAFTGNDMCIDIRGAAVTAEHVNIHDCSGYGVSYMNGSLALDGSTVTRCTNGGIAISGQTFVITNNFVTSNGSNSSVVGGIGILVTTIANTSRLDFNTVAANDVRSLGTDAGGIYCNDTSFAAIGDVVVHNAVSGSIAAATANTGGSCRYLTSAIQQSDALGFVSAMANNYHLTATSVLRDVPGVATGPATDVDGESRPYGSGYDIGADEYHP